MQNGQSIAEVVGEVLEKLSVYRVGSPAELQGECLQNMVALLEGIVAQQARLDGSLREARTETGLILQRVSGIDQGMAAAFERLQRSYESGLRQNADTAQRLTQAMLLMEATAAALKQKGEDRPHGRQARSARASSPRKQATKKKPKKRRAT